MGPQSPFFSLKQTNICAFTEIKRTRTWMIETTSRRSSVNTRDILLRIRIRESVPRTYESCSLQDAKKYSTLLYLSLFEGTF